MGAGYRRDAPDAHHEQPAVTCRPAGRRPDEDWSVTYLLTFIEFVKIELREQGTSFFLSLVLLVVLLNLHRDMGWSKGSSNQPIFGKILFGLKDIR